MPRSWGPAGAARSGCDPLRPLGCALFHHFSGFGVEFKERVKHVRLQRNPMIAAFSRCPQVDLVAVETGVQSVAEVSLCFHLLPLLSFAVRHGRWPTLSYLIHHPIKRRMLAREPSGRRGPRYAVKGVAVLVSEPVVDVRALWKKCNH